MYRQLTNPRPAAATSVARLYIVESQVLFIAALRELFEREAGVAIVGHAAGVAPRELRDARPDVVLLDIGGNAEDLSDALSACKEAVPSAHLLVLSMRMQPAVMQRCLDSGVRGYLIKDVDPSELVRAVRSIASGETFVDARVAGGLLRRRRTADRTGAASQLSARESSVLVLIAGGLANKEIGVRLALSEKTVKNHISRIFVKLAICSRSQAAVKAIKMGLV